MDVYVTTTAVILLAQMPKLLKPQKAPASAWHLNKMSMVQHPWNTQISALLLHTSMWCNINLARIRPQSLHRRLWNHSTIYNNTAEAHVTKRNSRQYV